ncbi:hypothetical protein ACFQ48_18285 [Hymenobacter caeli]|uniref:Heavy-metal-associated domain-containing protein n=1 Tax=Hymenobacter caeli TaxID=2735894 RepID=A0ABX2FQY6_9BACT|nr:hypothetical protein [Hymenobacter caeli]NRT19529.1 hypothetical protein [Hymenobacter caeli]
MSALLRRGWVVGPLALLAWANWEAPALHSYAAPIELVAWQVPHLPTGPAAEALRAHLAAQPGVRACALSAATGTVSFVYRPGEATEAGLRRALAGAGPYAPRALPAAPAPAPAARQCPVPAGYVLGLERLRFALNLRRFFVAV